MIRLFPFFLVGAAILIAQESRGNAPAKEDGVKLPVGKWNVSFLNGVKEECEIGKEGKCSVDEPLRQSNGTAEVKGSATVLTFNDERVERWTPAGKRYLVEHWFPASQFPEGEPVLGIAERAP